MLRSRPPIQARSRLAVARAKAHRLLENAQAVLAAESENPDRRFLRADFSSIASLRQDGRVADLRQRLSLDDRVMAIMARGNVRIGSIVVDVKDFGRMMTFWQKALGYAPRRPPTPGDPFVILGDPTGKGPNVSLDGMEPYRNRLHLDLYTDDPDREVERLLQLGATLFRAREEGEDFVVLADPDGNLFCVVDTRG